MLKREILKSITDLIAVLITYRVNKTNIIRLINKSFKSVIVMKYIISQTHKRFYSVSSLINAVVKVYNLWYSIKINFTVY